MADNLIQKKDESTWYVRLAVPIDVQKAMGCKVLTQSLKTGLRKEAMNARLPYLAQWKAQFAIAREQVKVLKENWRPELASKSLAFDGIVDTELLGAIKIPAAERRMTLNIPSTQLAQFLQGRSALIQAARKWEENGPKGIVQQVVAHFETFPATMVEAVERSAELVRSIEEQMTAYKYNLTPTEAMEAKSIVQDPTVYKPKSPITPARLKAFREFRESRGGVAKHVRQQISRLEHLSAFLAKGGLHLNFNSVDEWLRSMDRAPATLGQHAMAGTAFWKWAMMYEPAWIEEYKDKANPFTGHQLPKGGGRKTAGQDREIYTQPEAQRLHQAAMDKGDRPLADLISLGWYTGARIEDLCNLTVSKIITVDGVLCFDFPLTKSKASKRVVPIHPNLLQTIDRLISDSTDTYLIPTSSKNQDDKRSHAISKAFGRVRTATGFGPLHVFHSFRHTAVTAMIRADVPDALAKELVGHIEGSVTHDVYSKGASTAQKLAAISKLPALLLKPSEA